MMDTKTTGTSAVATTIVTKTGVESPTTYHIIIPSQSNEPFHRDPAFADWWSKLNSPVVLMRKDLDQPPNEIEEEFKIKPSCYKFIMNVHQFTPSELTIKINETGNKVIIDGAHASKVFEPSQGFSSRAFTRTYALPSNVDVEEATANLSSDGVLQIVVPKCSKHSSNPGSSGNTSPNGSSENIDDHILTAEELRHLHELAADAGSAAKLRNGSLASKAKHWFEKYYHELPDFHFEPFWKRFGSYNLNTGLGIHSDNDYFRVLVDVKHFTPLELTVSATEHFVTIQGKHEDKADAHGHISRKFTQRFDLPKCVRACDIRCYMKPYGLLEVCAPKFKPITLESEELKLIPITQVDDDGIVVEGEGRRDSIRNLGE